MTGKRNQDNLQPCPSGIFHCGDAIGVIGNQNDPLDRLGHAKVGDVQADPHIDPLLFEVGLEVIVREVTANNPAFFRFVAPKFQDAEAYREKLFASNRLQPAVVARKNFLLTGHGSFACASETRAIIVEGPEQVFFARDASPRDLFYEIRFIFEPFFPCENAEMSAINENSDFFQNKNPPNVAARGVL